MSAALALAGSASTCFALFAALGSGPASVLLRRLPDRMAFAPLLGVAASAVLLASAASLMPLSTATGVLLVPAAIVSLGWTVLRRRSGDAGLQLRSCVISVGMATAGATLVLLPPVLRDTRGPVAFRVYDSAHYIQASLWLRDHAIGDPLPAGADLSLVFGRAVAGWDARVGSMAFDASLSSLLGLPPDETHAALLAVLVASAVFGLWGVARGLGCGLPSAAAAAAFGLSPAILTLAADGQVANLVALALAPSLLFLVGFGAVVSEALAAALLVAALLAAYPEALPHCVSVGLALAVARAAIRPDWRRGLRDDGWRLAGILALGAALGPLTTLRAATKLVKVMTHTMYKGSLDFPPRDLGLLSGWAWSLGARHVYELQTNPPSAAVLTVLASLSVLVLWGCLRGGLRKAVLILGPMLVALGVGLAARAEYGGCSYCLWKSLTLATPFVALGLACGVAALSGVARLPGLGVMVLGLALLLSADARLVGAWKDSPALISTELRRMVGDIRRLPAPARVFLEGADGTQAPLFTLPMEYYLLRSVPGIQVSFSVDKVVYLVAPPKTQPSYEYVMTNFGGVRSARALVARQGPYSLFRRAPIDVALTNTGPVLEGELAQAIPWVKWPFGLRIDSPLAADVAVRLEVFPPERGATFTFTRDGARVAARAASDNTRYCLELPVAAGVTTLEATAWLAAQNAKSATVGISSATAQAGRCSDQT